MEWHDASCVRVSSRASLPFGCEVFIVSNDFVPSLGGLNKWNNELGLFLFSSPSSCLMEYFILQVRRALRVPESRRVFLSRLRCKGTTLIWHKTPGWRTIRYNSHPFVLHEGKVYFWGFKLGGIWQKTTKCLLLFVFIKKKMYLCAVKKSFKQLGEIRTCAGGVCVEILATNC